MFTFRGGFGWGIGGVLGKAFGVLIVAAAVIAVFYFGWSHVKSAVSWILGVALYAAIVAALAWYGSQATGRLRRRRLVWAAVLAIYGVFWLQNTSVTRLPSATSSTAR